MLIIDPIILELEATRKVKIIMCSIKKYLRAYPINSNGQPITEYGAVPFPRNESRIDGTVYELEELKKKEKSKGSTRKGWFKKISE